MALNYVNLAILTIAHLAGLVVAIILLLKFKGPPAILAAVAFVLMFIQDIGKIMRVAFLDRLIVRQMVLGVRQTPWAIGSLDCCCGALDLIAIVCLLVAIWQALSATGGNGDKGAEVEEVTGEFVEFSEEAVEGGA